MSSSPPQPYRRIKRITCWGPRREAILQGLLQPPETDALLLEPYALAQAIHAQVVEQGALSPGEPGRLPAVALVGGFLGPGSWLSYSGPKGLSRSTPHSSKSLVFRVATDSPRDLAIAAIWPSGTLIGRPDSLRNPIISP